MRVGRAVLRAYLALGKSALAKIALAERQVGRGGRTLAGTGCAGRSRGAACRLARVCTAAQLYEQRGRSMGSAVLDAQRGKWHPTGRLARQCSGVTPVALAYLPVASRACE